LLIIVKGTRSWKEIHTFNGIEYPIYKAAAIAQGILEDNGE
jgi:hypothetical protein